MILIRKEKHDAVIQMKNMAYAERVSLEKWKTIASAICSLS